MCVMKLKEKKKEKQIKTILAWLLFVQNGTSRKQKNQSHIRVYTHKNSDMMIAIPTLPNRILKIVI